MRTYQVLTRVYVTNYGLNNIRVRGTNNARDLISELTAFCFIVFLILLSEFVEVLRFRYASSRG